MRLHCLSLGPRDRGRDHGLLARFDTLPLPRECKAMIGDYALAMFEWGLEPRPPFAAFFPLDAARSLYLLARSAYLERDLLGPKVITNGLVLDEAALDAARWRPHLLLPHLQPPGQGAWTESEIEIDLAAAGAPVPPAPNPHVVRLGRYLRMSSASIRLELEGGAGPEETVAGLVETSRLSAARPFYWATSPDLVRIGRFDPEIFRAVVHRVAPGAPPVEPGVFRLGPAGLEGPDLHDSPVARVWEALFPETLPADWATRFPAAAEAIRAMAEAHYPEGRLDDDPGTVAVDDMLEALRRPGIDALQLWGLMEHWAKAGSALGGEDEAVVHLAVGATLRRLVGGQSDRQARLTLIKGYVALLPLLPRGAPKLSASVVAEHDLIDGLDDDELALLVGLGLGEAYTAATEKAVRAGRIIGPRLAVVARALGEILERGGSVPQASLELAATLIERGLDAAERDEHLFASVGLQIFLLSEQVLLTGMGPTVPQSALAAMLQSWRLAERFKARSPVMERLIAAPRRALKGPGGRDDRRRAWVAMAVFENRGAR